jgi:hypothetical protein
MVRIEKTSTFSQSAVGLDAMKVFNCQDQNWDGTEVERKLGNNL